LGFRLPTDSTKGFRDFLSTTAAFTLTTFSAAAFSSFLKHPVKGAAINASARRMRAALP